MPQRALVDFAVEWMKAHRVQRDISPLVTIRALDKDDFERWVRLRRALWPHHDPAELEAEAEEISSHLETTPVFVAQLPERRLRGMVEVAVRDGAFGCTTDRVGYLEAWYVEPGFRRRGIGRMLVERAEEWARAQGCTEMASDTTPRYPLSPAAHERLGYRVVKRKTHFRKELV